MAEPDNTNPVGSQPTNLNTGGDTGGGMSAVAESMGALTKITQGISGVVEGIFQVIGKLFNAIMDASPLLQGVLKIVDKMFKLVLMPIGNIIGRLLLPFVIKMARKTVDFLNKFGNAGPDQIGDVLTQGLTAALESMVDILVVVLQKVLWPVITALAQSIINALIYVFSGGLAGSLAAPQGGEQSLQDMVGQDLQDLMGAATGGMTDVINQFGVTVQTGNRIMGNSFSESATVFYKGSADIANGFQSVHEVLVIGTTKAIQKFASDFNLAGAGLVTTIDTVKTSFGNLVSELDKWFVTLKPPETPPVATPPAKDTSPTVTYIDLNSGDLATKDKEEIQRKTGYGGIATFSFGAEGGIITRPTNLIAGEAGPEALIPLDKGNIGTKSAPDIHVHFHGDVYGMDDFERRIEKSVGKYSSKVRGAY